METLNLDPLQQEAVDAACNMDNRVVVVEGPAGSGKTTILRIVHERLTAHGYSVALCSPTGKAAKRIYEATGIEASTVHRLLEYTHPGDPDPKTGKPVGSSYPRRGRAGASQNGPLEQDVILVDEYAMVNQEVHRSLLDALRGGAVIRVFGDGNQLAPIEEDKRLQSEPSPFNTLLKNAKIKSVRLDTVFRQGADSGILLNANLLLKSRMPTKNEQWTQKITDQPVKELRAYVEEMWHEHEVSFAETTNQILVPQNTSWVGTKALNAMIQGLFHNEADPSTFVPRKDQWKDGKPQKTDDIRMYIGDKVIYTTNNYDLGVFNGETGRIIEVEEDTGALIVDFGDREQEIPTIQYVLNRYGNQVEIDPRKDLDLAYAITTHKSQGSEYSRVVYIINKSNSFMLSRRNFYTAVTRAREHVLILADQRGLSMAVHKRD